MMEKFSDLFMFAFYICTISVSEKKYFANLKYDAGIYFEYLRKAKQSGILS